MNAVQTHKPPALREAHLRDYWKVVWQGRWTILAIFVAILGATAVWTFLQTPIYRATATIEIEPQARRLIAGGDVSGMGARGLHWFAEEKYHNTQIEIIRSRDVSRRVVRLLDLESHPHFSALTDPVDVFRRQIQVDPRRETGLLEISISGADPHEITRWANAVAEAYVTRNFEKARSNVKRAITAINEQMNAFGQELSDAEAVRIGALEDAQIINPESQEEIIRQKLQTLTTELTDASIERNQLEDTLDQIERMRAEGGDLTRLPELAEDETLRGMLTSHVELERQLERAKVELRPGHPDYEEIESELAKVEQRVGDQIDRIVGGLEKRHKLASLAEQHLQKQIRDVEQTSLEVAKASSTYYIKKTDAEMKQQVFELIAKTLNEAQLNAELMNNNVSILDEAIPPRFPIKPRKRINLGMGAMFGLFLGIAVVFFLDYLDNTIRTPEDVEKFLGLSVLSVVPKMRGGHGLSQRAIREAFQSLRTSIIFSSKNRQRKAVLITSTGPQEGKSSTVANLGRTMAAAGEKVVIVDCDLRRPKQHRHHEVDRDPGLTNYLAAPTEQKDWEIYLKNGETAGLQIMTSGPLPPSPPELLGNSRFAELLSTLRERYDWVLVDSPPAATLADAALLASLSDMIVAVVQHNATDRDHVVKTLQQLRSVNAELAGVVLNNVDLDRAYHKDYYYAGYYYEEEGEKKPRKRGLERKAKVG